MRLLLRSAISMYPGSGPGCTAGRPSATYAGSVRGFAATGLLGVPKVAVVVGAGVEEPQPASDAIAAAPSTAINPARITAQPPSPPGQWWWLSQGWARG